MLGNTIDLHCHFLPDFYRTALEDAGLGLPDGIAALPQWNEVDHLAMMDKLGVEKAYLSISSPGVHFGDDKAARDLSRKVNLEAARLRDAYPGRFGFFASTPLPDIDGTLEEIAFAIDELQADGFVFGTNFHGKYLGDALLEPVFAELNRRKALLFLHPTRPGTSCACGDPRHDITLGYPAPMLEFIFDTTRTVTDFVLSGRFDQHPDIRLLVPHAGAALPLLSERIDLVGPLLAAPGQPHPPSLKKALRRMHFDLAGAPVPEMLDALLSVADEDKIHYGSDWPFTPVDVCASLKDKLEVTTGLTDHQKAKFFRGNVGGLFGPAS